MEGELVLGEGRNVGELHSYVDKVLGVGEKLCILFQTEWKVWLE